MTDLQAQAEPTPPADIPEGFGRREDGTIGMNYRGLVLDAFQEEAIRHVQANRSVLVSAPTGTGKTIIADYIVEQALAQDKEVIYTAPIKALSNQKFRDYSRTYGASWTGLITGDLVINRDAPVRVMTTEILRNMLLQGEKLEKLAYVIVDEIHFLDDVERGTVWEEVLIYLPPHVKILGLSATLANIREFSDWLAYVRNEEVPVVIEDERSVPLSIYLANRDAGVCDLARYEYLHAKWRKMAKAAQNEERSQRARSQGGRRPRAPRRLRMPGQKETRHYELVKLLGANFRPILYFAFSRKMTEQFARELARKTPEPGFTTPEEAAELKAAVDKFDVEFPKVMTSEQEAMYIKGIAFHHAGAHVGIKAFVEELYERKLIKVLYCTSTFALGINMPARTTCFQALRKYDGRRVVPLTVRQFMQKAGRAGRRGIDHVGYVVILEEFSDFEQDEEAIRQYIKGRHEEVRSSFNLSFNSVVNLLDRHAITAVEAQAAIELSEGRAPVEPDPDDREAVRAASEALVDRRLQGIRTIIEKSFLNFHFLQQARREQERLDDIRRNLVKAGWDPEDEEAGAPPRHLVNRSKKYSKLQRTAHRQSTRVWRGFMEKVQLLQTVEYLAPDLSFNAGARVLRHIQIEEVFSSELVLSGVLDELPEDLLFGALCTLSNSFSRTTSIRCRPKPDEAQLARAMRKIRFGRAVRTAEEAGGPQVTFTPEMIAFGRAWYEGRSLGDLSEWVESATDISGDLVSAFRRAKDLSQQLRRVFEEDPFMTEKLRSMAKTVTRDEVEVLD